MKDEIITLREDDLREAFLQLLTYRRRGDWRGSDRMPGTGQELLDRIDRIAWGDNVTPRQYCPLCWAASVEGHDNDCPLGQLRDRVQANQMKPDFPRLTQ